MRERLIACNASSELGLRLVGDPVDVVTGACFDSVRDAIVDSPMPMEWRRFHSSERTEDAGLGPGWRHSFDHRLVVDLDGLRYDAPDGTSITFPFLGETRRAAKKGYVLTRDGDVFQVRPPDGPSLTFRSVVQSGMLRLERIATSERATVVDFSPFNGGLIGFTDCIGNRLLVDYEGRNIVGVRVQRAAGGEPIQLVRYTYDRGYLVDAENAYHHHLRYTYSAAGLIVRRTDRRGYSFLFDFDREGRCIRSAGEDGLFAVQLKYFPLDGRTEVTQPDGGVWTYFFDTNRNITSIVDSAGATREFVIRQDGQIATESAPTGNEIRYVYTGEGRLVGKRDAEGRWIDEEIPYPIPTKPLEYEWGHLGDAEHLLPLAPPEGFDAHSSDFDLPLIGGAAVAAPLRANLHPSIYAALTFARDETRGRTVHVRDVQGLLVRDVRDDRTRRFGYDPNGNRVWEIDFDGGRTEHKIASLNQIVETVDANGRVTRFAYAKNDELCAVSDPLDTVTEFWRDGHDRLTKVVRAGKEKEAYLRDAAGQLVEKKDGEGRSLYTLKRGPQGEVLERTFANGDFERYAYDREMRIARAESVHANVELAHDWRGRRTRDARDGKGAECRFAGDVLVEMMVFGRFATRYRYRGLLGKRSVTITDPTGREHHLRDIGDGVFERTFGNGFSETIQYHPEGHCLARFVYPTKSPATRWDRRYEYGGEGHLLAAFDSLRGVTRYEQDAAHRLSVERLPNGKVRQFRHDAAGNVLQNGDGRASYHPGNLLAEASGRRFQHDARQAVAMETWFFGCRRFQRDARDQLIGLEYFNLMREGGRATYTPAGLWTAKYDALNRRIAKTSGEKTTAFYWHGERLIAEVLPTGALRIYVYADAVAMTPILFVDYAGIDAPATTGSVYVVFANHLGCPEAVQDMNGEWVWRAEIEPYGLAHVEVGVDFHQPLRWPGHYFDAEIGLQYNRFRTYSPEIGRYLEPDPLGRDGGLENVYQYTNNPLYRVDIQGTRICPHTGIEVDEKGFPVKRDEEGKPVTGPPTKASVRKKLEQAREAFARAEMHEAGLTGSDKRRTVTSNGHETISGYTKPVPHGFSRVEAPIMLGHQEQIGHPVRPAPGDVSGPKNAPLKQPGAATATHTEKQNAVLQRSDGTNDPMGVSKEQCGDCRGFYQKEAINREQPITIADPAYTRVYQPDGSVQVYDPNHNLVQSVPQGAEPTVGQSHYQGVPW